MENGQHLACGYGEDCTSQVTSTLDEYAWHSLPARYLKTCSLWTLSAAITCTAELTRCPAQGSSWTFTASRYATFLNPNLNITCSKKTSRSWAVAHLAPKTSSSKQIKKFHKTYDAVSHRSTLSTNSTPTLSWERAQKGNFISHSIWGILMVFFNTCTLRAVMEHKVFRK